MTLVIAGDFRHTLPVIRRSTPADELNACLKALYLWQHVEKLSLSTNMRVYLHSDFEAGRFVDLLLEVGIKESCPTKVSSIPTILQANGKMIIDELATAEQFNDIFSNR